MGKQSAAPRVFEHPSSEEEIQDVVRSCAARREPLRVIGSAHSEPDAIGPPDVRTLMLDRMRAVSIEEGPTPVVGVEAGCNLGRDPYDPTKTSRWSNSLNATLEKAGHALPDLGGITHQTVAGFLATGSCGGSVRYSVFDALERLRFVDGTGTIHEVSASDSDPKKRDLFYAAGVSMGLLGVVTKVWFKLEPTYAIAGQQTTRTTADTPIDFFGDEPGAMAFEDYLRETPYSRLLWWPQHDFDRMVVWQAQRMKPPPGFSPRPYVQLGSGGRLASLAGSLLHTILGNLDDLSAVPPKLEAFYAQLDDVVEGDRDPNACPSVASPRRRIRIDEVLAYLATRLRRGFAKRGRQCTLADLAGSPVAERLARFLGTTAERIVEEELSDLLVGVARAAIDGTLGTPLAVEAGRILKAKMPECIDGVASAFVPLDEDGPQIFQDTWMCGLPMDNQMDDTLWPTVFTELWIPMHRARAAMACLRELYAGGGDPKVAYERTGPFACEIYPAKRSRFWMSPAFDTDVVRFDFFWFGLSAGDPTETFYPRFWDALRPFEFRPHWGKVLPRPADEYARYYRSVFPRLEDFLALRAKLDPSGVFATDYFRQHLAF